jgi:hypothetical protein
MDARAVMEGAPGVGQGNAIAVPVKQRQAGRWLPALTFAAFYALSDPPEAAAGSRPRTAARRPLANPTRCSSV